MIWRPKGILDDWELDVWLYRRFGKGEDVEPDELTAVDPMGGQRSSLGTSMSSSVVSRPSTALASRPEPARLSASSAPTAQARPRSST